MPIYELIIIGSGPSGLMCASYLKNCGHKVIVLEKNDNPGRKLLISGSGQCNFTHTGEVKEFIKHYFEGKNFLKHSIYSFSNKDAVKFFEKNGVKSITTDSGKVFPRSLKAKDILDALLENCWKNKVEIRYREMVKRVSLNDGVYKIETENNSYKAKRLLIATGGKSFPKTGSAGDGYILAKSLGHSIVKPKPSLTPLLIKDVVEYVESDDNYHCFYFNELAGISFYNKKVSLYRMNKKVFSTNGDFLFTHNGLSGPAILSTSRFVEKNDIICLSFVDYENKEKFRQYFLDECYANKDKLIRSILHYQNIAKKIVLLILMKVGIPKDLRVRDISKKILNKIVDLIIGYPFGIKDVGDFNIAIVTRGGVSLTEVNSKTMESRINKNLYFAGEVLDIDGETGGYNIQSAFSTGYIVANSITLDIENNW